MPEPRQVRHCVIVCMSVCVCVRACVRACVCVPAYMDMCPCRMCLSVYMENVSQNAMSACVHGSVSLDDVYVCLCTWNCVTG